MKKIIYIVGTLLLLFPLLSNAQALPFTIVDTDPVVLGKGGTGLTETGSVSHAAFTNAAAVVFSESALDIAGGYTMWQPSAAKSNIINVAGAFKLNDKLGVAAGIYYGANAAYDITDANGSISGKFSPSDIHAASGVAYKILPSLALGVNFGYATSTLAQGVSYGTTAADIFVMTEFSGFTATAGVSNVLGTIEGADGKKYCIPGSIALGAGYGKNFGERNRIEADIDLDYFFLGGLAASFGAEYIFNDFVSLRAGYRYGGESPIPSFASIGAGVKFSDIKVNLAYIAAGAESPLKNTLALSLGYSF